MKRKFIIMIFALCVVAAIAISSQTLKAQEASEIPKAAIDEQPLPKNVQTCSPAVSPTLEGYKEMDAMQYLEHPDPNILSATGPLDETFMAQLLRNEIRLPFQKTYCQIGVTRFVMDMTYPVEDDAVSHKSLRAIYQWQTSTDQIGWQISEIGERFICARSTDQTTGRCL